MVGLVTASITNMFVMIHILEPGFFVMRGPPVHMRTGEGSDIPDSPGVRCSAEMSRSPPIRLFSPSSRQLDPKNGVVLSSQFVLIHPAVCANGVPRGIA